MSHEKLDQGAVEAVAQLARDAAQPQPVTIEGRVYHRSSMGLREVEPAQLHGPPVLEVATLQGVVDYVREVLPADLESMPDGAATGQPVVVVSSPSEVTVTTEVVGHHRQRFLWCQAQAPEAELPYFSLEGGYYDPATTILGLQVLTVPSPERDQLLKLLGGIRVEAGAEVKDDGLSQSVTVRGGVALMAEAKIPSPVTLLPRWGFPEVGAPEVPFIVRLTGGEHGPRVGLFAADGGLWVATQTAKVATWLREKLEDTGAVVLS